MKTEHEVPSYLLEFHTCELCRYKTKSQVLFECHIRRCGELKSESYFYCELSNLEQFKCHICDFKNDMKLVVHRHIKLAHGNINKFSQKLEIMQSYICDKCSFEAYCILTWIQHICRLKIEEISKSRTLKKQKHPEDINCFQCDHCFYKTKWKYHLKRHILVKHMKPEAIEWFECNHCSYKAKLKSNLKTHIFHKHEKLQNMEWSEDKHCSYKAKRKNQIFSQCKTTGEIKWYECGHCFFKTKWKGNLKQHILKKHEKSENIRNRCSYKANEQSQRNINILMEYTKPGEITWFQCEHCSYKTKWKSHLHQHISTKHANPGDIEWFECDQCCHKSKDKRNMKRHILEKHGKPENIKWFECDRCCYKAKRRSHLKRHVEKAHFCETPKCSTKQEKSELQSSIL